MRIAVAHDYLTQRGGAERVVLSMLRAFPGASVYTSLYEPSTTFQEFEDADVRATVLNRVPALRGDHRLAFPFLAPTMSRLHVDADVVLCSSSGWAHGVTTPGRKIVYCHAPARWLYQTRRYAQGLGLSARIALPALSKPLRAWDLRAARSASRYMVNSTHVAAAVRKAYGIEAEVVPPPPAVVPGEAERSIDGLEPGFILCVSRLLAYKNVDNVVAAFAHLPEERLVLVGLGPEAARLEALAPDNVLLLGSVKDDELRWLYRSCASLVTAAHEDFGLTPLEAASFGKPAAVLRYGGFLDTLVEGVTGLFFDEATPSAIAETLENVRAREWAVDDLQAHAGRFSEERFVERLRAVVREEATPAPRRTSTRAA